MRLVMTAVKAFLSKAGQSDKQRATHPALAHDIGIEGR